MRLLLILLLAGCADVPELKTMTPAQARSFGVGVQDGRTITGIIAETHIAEQADIQKQCGDNSELFFHGCALALDGAWPDKDHRYIIWSTDTGCWLNHEKAHAWFESVHHTGQYIQRANAGESWAACPK